MSIFENLKGRTIVYGKVITDEKGKQEFVEDDELIHVVRCRECKWYLSNWIKKSPFDIDGFDRWDGLAQCQHENGMTECDAESYCSDAERKEEWKNL